jgi:hypothetical protein
MFFLSNIDFFNYVFISLSLYIRGLYTSFRPGPQIARTGPGRLQLANDGGSARKAGVAARGGAGAVAGERRHRAKRSVARAGGDSKCGGARAAGDGDKAQRRWRGGWEWRRGGDAARAWERRGGAA